MSHPPPYVRELFESKLSTRFRCSEQRYAHGIRDGQAGTVTVIQRFGSGLQLNLHYHTLVLDAVVSEAQPGRLTFHTAPPPGDEDVARVLVAVRTRVGRLLTRRQVESSEDHAPPDPVLRQDHVRLAWRGSVGYRRAQHA